jgi:hypothetical protein
MLVAFCATKCTVWFAKKLSFGHYPRCSGHVCQLYRLSMDELAAFFAGYFPMTV